MNVMVIEQALFNIIFVFSRQVVYYPEGFADDINPMLPLGLVWNGLLADGRLEDGDQLRERVRVSE